MNQDLNPMMRDWPFEPGTIQVRTVVGDDGTLKLQLRLDLGILQMEMTGRPDGQTPFGCASLLEHYEKVAARCASDGKGEIFRLTGDDCMKLQQEGIQFYHRY